MSYLDKITSVNLLRISQSTLVISMLAIMNYDEWTWANQIKERTLTFVILIVFLILMVVESREKKKLNK